MPPSPPSTAIQLLTPGPPHPDPAHTRLPHVLLILDGFPKALGGGERIVLRLAQFLPSYGFRASILTLNLHPQSAFHPADAPCPVYLLPLTNSYGLDAWRGAFALSRLLRAQNVRIVHTFFESSDLWAGLVTRLFSSAKLIWSRRDMGILRGPKHTLAYRALHRLPHAVIAVSQSVASHVITIDRVAPERVHIVHNGLDLDPSPQPQRKPPHTPPVITTIGNVRHIKGHDLLLTAARQVTDRFPEAQFTIAGEVLDPVYFAELQQQLTANNLTDTVHFLGKITNLPQHLATADIFVLPSRSEGFSNALIEAMAAGLPCIATDVGGNNEAIEDGENGCIVPSEDPSALANAILHLLLNPDYARSLADQARQTVEDHFTADAMMCKVARIFQSVQQQ